MLEVNKIYNMDCIDGMKLLDDNSIDAIVTDPPYGLGFMGKEWDIYDKGTSEFEGWGTALKPAHEPIVVARKPLSEKTVAENVLKWGTGGINIDECRIEIDKEKETDNRVGTDEVRGEKNGLNSTSIFGCTEKGVQRYKNNGRFPANVIHDGSPEVLQEFEKAGNCGAFAPVKLGQKEWGGTIYHKFNTSGDDGQTFYKDGLGTPARFFKSCEFELEDAPSFIYQAKASKSERNAGLAGFEEQFKAGAEFRPNHLKKALNGANGNPFGRWDKVKNIHPTVKPLKLMQYLVRLVTPKDGIVLDPFMGSGTTGMAAKSQGYNYIGFDITKEYCDIAEARINNICRQTKL